MSLQFPCPCGRLLQVPEDLSGKRVRCPSCSRIVWAPAEQERVPEARLVDSAQAAKSEPVAASAPPPAQPPKPESVPVAVCSASPAPASGSCCTRHDCGAVGGFVLTLGSLVFGVVAPPLFAFSWPVGGSIGALVSCGALRRIREGRGNPASVGLARAGLAIGLGQALLGFILWAAFGAIVLKSGGCCGSGSRARQNVPSRTVAPAVQREQPQQRLPDAEETDRTEPAHH